MSRITDAWLVAGSGLAAVLALWLALAPKSRLFGWLGIALCVLAGGTILRVLHHRQTKSSSALPPAAWRRLALFGGAALAIAVASVGTWLAYARAYGLVHPARIAAARTPDSVRITNYQSVAFLSSDGLTLHGWYAPTHNGAAIVLVHGHGSNRGELLDDAALLTARGYGVLLFDLRNSGESEGTITTFGLLEVNDVRGAVDFVAAQPGVDPARIGLLGHSMGGATVILAGARLPAVSAVVAESAYTSIEDNIESGVRALTGLPPFPFAPLVVFFGQREAGLDITTVRPIDEIASLSPRPILLVHGDHDETVPVDNTFRLYAAARPPKELYIIAGAGHCCLPQIEPETYAHRVIGFFARYLLRHLAS